MPKQLRPIWYVVVACSLLMGIVSMSEGATMSAKVTWVDQSTDEKGFAIQRKIGATGAYAEVGKVLANITVFADPSAPAASVICYRVLAFNDNGSSVPGPEACGNTAVPMPPGATTVLFQTTP